MILDNPSYFGKFSLVIFVILMILVNGRIVVALVILGVLVNLVNFASLLDLAILMSLVNLETHCTTALHSRAGGGTCVACVNWVKDPTSLSLLQNGGVLYAPGGQPLGEEGEERSDAGTVHSKCSRTGSAYPVAIGHRGCMQQEMLK